MKKITGVLVVTLIAFHLVGCMGQMGLSQMAMGVNLKAVDNRYGRAGIYILASPIYAITSAVDLFFINSIEFWTGTNPLTKKSPAVVDTPVEAWMKVDDKLDPGASKPPLSWMNTPIEKIEMVPVDGDGMKMIIEFSDGTVQTVKGVRKAGEDLKIYVNEELVALADNDQLQQYFAEILQDQGTATVAQR